MALLNTFNQVHRKSGKLRSASSFPVGAANGKTWWQRNPERTKFSQDFLFLTYQPQKSIAALMGSHNRRCAIRPASRASKSPAFTACVRTMTRRTTASYANRARPTGRRASKFLTTWGTTGWMWSAGLFRCPDN